MKDEGRRMKDEIQSSSFNFLPFFLCLLCELTLSGALKSVVNSVTLWLNKDMLDCLLVEDNLKLRRALQVGLEATGEVRAGRGWPQAAGCLAGSLLCGSVRHAIHPER